MSRFENSKVQNNKSLIPNLSRGFSLLEILLVFGILAILVISIVPLSVNLFRSYQLDSSTQGVIQTLRRAQLKAMSIESDSDFGVYLTNDNYTLFKGSSYATREAQYDEISGLPFLITINAQPKEVVFFKSEGRPSVIGNIILNSNGESWIININKMGRINLEL